MLINYGFWTLYNPDTSIIAADHPWRKFSALFLKNEKEVDWYSIAHSRPKKMSGIVFVMVEQDGDVISIGDDAEAMWPINCYFIETDLPVKLHDKFNGELFITKEVKVFIPIPIVEGPPSSVA